MTSAREAAGDASRRRDDGSGSLDGAPASTPWLPIADAPKDRVVLLGASGCASILASWPWHLERKDWPTLTAQWPKLVREADGKRVSPTHYALVYAPLVPAVVGSGCGCGSTTGCS